MANERGEALLAVIGIDVVLEPGDFRFTAPQRDEAAALPKAIQRQVRRFLEETGFDKATALEPLNFKRWAKLLEGPPDPKRVEEAAGAFEDEDDALAFIQAASAAWAYLYKNFPRRSRQTVLGPVPEEPSLTYRSRFRRAHGVAQRPLVVLEDLNEGILSGDMVRALEAIFPTLYKLVGSTVRDELARLKARVPHGPTWELGYAKVQMLGILGQVPIKPGLTAALQKKFGEADPTTAKPPKLGALGNPGEAVQSPVGRVSLR